MELRLSILMCHYNTALRLTSIMMSILKVTSKLNYPRVIKKLSTKLFKHAEKLKLARLNLSYRMANVLCHHTIQIIRSFYVPNDFGILAYCAVK